MALTALSQPESLPEQGDGHEPAWALSRCYGPGAGRGPGQRAACWLAVGLPAVVRKAATVANQVRSDEGM